MLNLDHRLHNIQFHLQLFRAWSSPCHIQPHLRDKNTKCWKTHQFGTSWRKVAYPEHWHFLILHTPPDQLTFPQAIYFYIGFPASAVCFDSQHLYTIGWYVASWNKAHTRVRPCPFPAKTSDHTPFLNSITVAQAHTNSIWGVNLDQKFN